MGVAGGVYELPCRAGEAIGSLKILRNCLFPTPQRFLWYLLCFGSLHILGGREKGFFYCNIENEDGVVCRGFLLQNPVLRTKTHLQRNRNVRNKHQEDSTDGYSATTRTGPVGVKLTNQKFT